MTMGTMPATRTPLGSAGLLVAWLVAWPVAGLVGCSSSAAPIADAGVDQGLTIDAARTDARRDAPPEICPCFEGDGSYCGADAVERAAAWGCTLPDSGDTDLLTCRAGRWSSPTPCEHGCVDGEPGGASCDLVRCACFVRESWCGASAQRHALTLDPPCRVPLLPAHEHDLLGCDGRRWIVLDDCELGCHEAPTGLADACNPDASPDYPGWPECLSRPRIAYGVHPEASDRLRCAGITSDRIVQTIGSAPESAGDHGVDGTAAGGQPYTAAIDLSVTDLDDDAIRGELQALGQNGFAAWYRAPGVDGWPPDGAPHIHAVFAGVPMKIRLRRQVRAYLANETGLTPEEPYRFWTPPRDVRDIVELLFTRNYTP